MFHQVPQGGHHTDRQTRAGSVSLPRHRMFAKLVDLFQNGGSCLAKLEDMQFLVPYFLMHGAQVPTGQHVAAVIHVSCFHGAKENNCSMPGTGTWFRSRCWHTRFTIE